MNSLELQALVNYYSQKGYYRHVQALCKDVLKKKPNDDVLLFWKAFALGQEGL